MRVLQFKPSTHTNFGDEINNLLWPALIPTLYKRDGVFVGIGTLLDDKLTKERPMVVFGAGAGYGLPPDLAGVDVRFVRGPKTAHVLDLPESKSITDPAILLHEWYGRFSKYKCSFMPRWTTILHDPTIPERLSNGGVHTIDPTWPPDRVMMEIASSDVLITEALHGAVVADAFRIPWIPVYLESGHWFKWMDWCASMDLPYDPVNMNICSIAWAKDKGKRFLSTDGTFRYRLNQVKYEVEKMK